MHLRCKWPIRPLGSSLRPRLEIRQWSFGQLCPISHHYSCYQLQNHYRSYLYCFLRVCHQCFSLQYTHWSKTQPHHSLATSWRCDTKFSLWREVCAARSWSHSEISQVTGPSLFYGMRLLWKGCCGLHWLQNIRHCLGYLDVLSTTLLIQNLHGIPLSYRDTCLDGCPN